MALNEIDALINEGNAQTASGKKFGVWYFGLGGLYGF